jgi:hypothetical protein
VATKSREEIESRRSAQGPEEDGTHDRSTTYISFFSITDQDMAQQGGPAGGQPPDVALQNLQRQIHGITLRNHIAESMKDHVASFGPGALSAHAYVNAFQSALTRLRQEHAVEGLWTDQFMVQLFLKGIADPITATRIRTRFDADGGASMEERLAWFSQNLGTHVDPNTELTRLRSVIQKQGESAIDFNHRINAFAINMQHRPAESDLLFVFQQGLLELDHKRLATEADTLGAAVVAVTRDEQLLANHRATQPRAVLATSAVSGPMAPSGLDRTAGRLCAFCGRGVHEERLCTFKAANKCSNCFEIDSGHHYTQCPKPPRRPPTSSPGPARRVSEADRHQRRGIDHRLDPRRQQQYGRAVTCYTCRQPGHLARDCTATVTITPGPEEASTTGKTTSRTPAAASKEALDGPDF